MPNGGLQVKLHSPLPHVVGVSAAGVLMGTAWSALVLAELGRFTPVVPLLFGLAVGGWVAWRLGRRPGTEAPVAGDAGRLWWLALAVALGSLFFTLPPSEPVLGGWDPGVYVHTAAAVSRHDSLCFDEPDLARLPDADRSVVARNLHGITEPFGGMRILPDGRVSPQFHHLYPCLMAVAYALAGTWGALAVNPLLNVAAILALYALASRLVGRRLGVVAALLLAANPSQIWQAKFPTAEMLTQCLWVTGCFLLGEALARDRRDVTYGVLAGAALGLALLCRYDSVIVLALLGPALALFLTDAPGRRRLLVVAATFSIFALHAWLHRRFVAPYYAPLVGMVSRCLVAAAAGFCAILVLGQIPAVRRWWVRLGRRQALWRSAAVVVLVGWVVFSWYVRPRLVVDGRVRLLFGSVFDAVGRGAWLEALGGADARNLEYLVGIFGGLGLVVALGGLACLFFRLREGWQMAWLAASLGVMVLLVFRVFNDHFMMWVSRRFVPVVLPLLTVATVAGVERLGALAGKWRKAAGPVVAVGVVLLLIGLRLPQIRAMSTMREWPGLVKWLGPVAAAIPDAAQVYCDQPGFAAPLRYLYGKQAYELQSRAEDRYTRLASLMATRRRAGANVLFLSMNSEAPGGGVVGIPVAGFVLRSSITLQGGHAIPDRTRDKGGSFHLYEVRLSEEME